jgi:hypothetical protein
MQVEGNNSNSLYLALCACFSTCAFVTTEHQDISQGRRFFNQPNIAPTNTSSIINRISRTADLHSTIKRSVPAYLNPRGYLSTMKQGSTRSSLNTNRIQLKYQLRSTIQQGSTESVYASISLIRSQTSFHSQTKRQKDSTESSKNNVEDSFGSFLFWIQVVPQEKTKRIQPDPAKTT